MAPLLPAAQEVKSAVFLGHFTPHRGCVSAWHQPRSQDGRAARPRGKPASLTALSALRGPRAQGTLLPWPAGQARQRAGHKGLTLAGCLQSRYFSGLLWGPLPADPLRTLSSNCHHQTLRSQVQTVKHGPTFRPCSTCHEHHHHTSEGAAPSSSHRARVAEPTGQCQAGPAW